MIIHYFSHTLRSLTLIKTELLIELLINIPSAHTSHWGLKLNIKQIGHILCYISARAQPQPSAESQNSRLRYVSLTPDTR